MQQDWTIQSRGHHCAATGRTFTEGEQFYTLLYDEKTGYRREDLSEEAFRDRPADAPHTFFFSRATHTPPAPPPTRFLPAGQNAPPLPRLSPRRSADKPPRTCSASTWLSMPPGSSWRPTK